ncbi:hypothetical protein Thal_1571 [Thermocrinis albus DSM 14484]|uniref:Uncharacterized protein n=1 Tax=Thermocrinis albus (strain DSM 14484 / JCM 11386 / HI 11/12) TaxID=638303 RepID=D3SN70_THEAH|nr:hypothetical protein [Thermocrinis albus]ADC90200.1 hypothetical protein Thal_1571 [Thermocrinis albus DSM 14484]
MEQRELAHLLVILSGLLRATGIALVIYFIFSGARLRYVFLTVIITIGGIFSAVLGFILGILSFYHALLYEVFAGLVLISLVYMARREKTVLPKPKLPPQARCALCGAYIKPHDNYSAAKCGDTVLFFESPEHLIRFLEDFDTYVKAKELNLKEPSHIFVRSEGAWRRWK